MTFNFQLDDRVLNGFCRRNGYLDEVGDGVGNFIPNPQSMQEFFIEKVREYIFTNVQEFEVSVAIVNTKEGLASYISNTDTAISIKATDALADK